MRKLCIPVLCLLFLTACSGNKEKNKPDATGKEPVSAPAAEPTGEDNAIKEWLVGKEWKTENGGAPFAVLKVYSTDSCGWDDGKYHWTFKEGVFEMLGAEWPFTKVSDTSFSIYVKPTRKTFAYTFVKTL
jgi:hypothetical protein